MLDDYPPGKDNPDVAAKELGRLAKLGKIWWYPEGDHSPDIEVRPSKSIAKPDKVRMVRD